MHLIKHFPGLAMSNSITQLMTSFSVPLFLYQIESLRIRGAISLRLFVQGQSSHPALTPKEMEASRLCQGSHSGRTTEAAGAASQLTMMHRDVGQAGDCPATNPQRPAVETEGNKSEWEAAEPTIGNSPFLLWEPGGLLWKGGGGNWLQCPP